MSDSRQLGFACIYVDRRCSVKNSGVQRRLVISHVVALAPSSQNSKGCGFAGLAQEQLTQANPSGLFCKSIGLVLMGEDAGAAERHVLAGKATAERLHGTQPPPAGWKQ